MKIKFLNIIKEGVIDYPFKNTKKLTIINDEGKKVDIQCELAQTPEEKQQGLLHRDGLCDNCGCAIDLDYQIEMEEGGQLNG